MAALEKIKNRVIAPDCSILVAMKKMDEIKMKILFVYDGDKFEGILTLGDIQRAIIKGQRPCYHNSLEL
jgi:CBS domain-containing protein